jgi:hypothetical protein
MPREREEIGGIAVCRDSLYDPISLSLSFRGATERVCVDTRPDGYKRRLRPIAVPRPDQVHPHIVNQIGGDVPVGTLAAQIAGDHIPMPCIEDLERLRDAAGVGRHRRCRAGRRAWKRPGITRSAAPGETGIAKCTDVATAACVPAATTTAAGVVFAVPLPLTACTGHPQGGSVDETDLGVGVHAADPAERRDGIAAGVVRSKAGRAALV